MISIVWFRQDLRLSDNPALSYAASRGAVLPVYILDETLPLAGRPVGGAARWWLHHSLSALAKSLGGLVLLRGRPADLLPELARLVGATTVTWNRCYEPYSVSRDKALKADLSASGLDVASFNASLLFEPWQAKTGSGGPFKAYSPFWRACRAAARRGARPVAAHRTCPDGRSWRAARRLGPAADEAQLGARLRGDVDARRGWRARSPRRVPGWRARWVRRAAQSSRSAERVAPVAPLTLG